MSNEVWANIKKSWNWIWNSDSIWSWLVALIIIFIFVKYIFFPVLGLIMGTSLPLAGVESSSMDHQIAKDDFGILNLCGMLYTEDNKEHMDFEEYWEHCGQWYEENDIDRGRFLDFPMKNGFRKGDIIITWGRFVPEIGDIVIFRPNIESAAPRPIIHRIVAIDEDGVIETKGDHNKEQLTLTNNIYHTDETSITEEQLIGKAIFKIPYLGWIKIWLMDLLKLFFK